MKTRLLVPWLFLLAVAAAYLAQPFAGASHYGSIVRGNVILSHGFNLHEDPWTIAGEGRAWSNPNWLFDLSTTLIWESSGERGLMIAKLISSFLFLLVCGVVFSRRAGDGTFGKLSGLLTGCGVLFSAAYTAELWGLLLFVLLVELLASKRYALALLCAALSSNVHGVSLAAFAFAALSCGISHGLTVALFATMFVTPYLGCQAFTSARYFMGVVLAPNIDVTVFDFSIFSYQYAFLTVVLVLFGTVVARSRDYSRSTIFAAGAILLACFSRTFLPFALVASGLTITDSWRNVPAADKLRESVSRLNGSLGYFSGERESFAVTFLFFAFFIVYAVPLLAAPGTTLFLPATALDFLVERKLPFPLLHEADAGAYVEFRMSGPDGMPLTRAFLDDRGPVFDAKLWRTAKSFVRKDIPWRDLALRSGARTILCRVTDPMFEQIKSDPGWRLEYRSDEAREESPEESPQPRTAPWAVFTRL